MLVAQGCKWYRLEAQSLPFHLKPWRTLDTEDEWVISDSSTAPRHRFRPLDDWSLPTGIKTGRSGSRHTKFCMDTASAPCYQDPRRHRATTAGNRSPNFLKADRHRSRNRTPDSGGPGDPQDDFFWQIRDCHPLAGALPVKTSYSGSPCDQQQSHTVRFPRTGREKKGQFLSAVVAAPPIRYLILFQKG